MAAGGNAEIRQRLLRIRADVATWPEPHGRVAATAVDQLIDELDGPDLPEWRRRHERAVQRQTGSAPHLPS